MATHANERIQLRDISVNTPVHIDLERAKIETDFYRKNDGKYSIPVMSWWFSKSILQEDALLLEMENFIVGEKVRTLRHWPTFPESCRHSKI